MSANYNKERNGKKTEITPCLTTNDSIITTGILEDMNCH